MAIAWTKGRVIAGWFCIVLVLLVNLAYQLTQSPPQFDANILNLLDIGDRSSEVVSRSSASYQRKAMVVVNHDSDDFSKGVLTEMKLRLSDSESVSNAYTNPAELLDLQELASLYGRYPLAFLSAQGEVAREQNSYDYLELNYLKMMTQPGNPLVSLTAEDAPLLNIADWLNDRQGQTAWRQDGDFLYVEHEGKRYYSLFISLHPWAIDVDKVVDSVESLNTVFKTAELKGVSLLKSGFVFHTAAITAQAQFEMQLFGGLSLLGVVLLTWLYFRNITPLFNVSLLIAVSTLAGFSALVLVFDSIHLISLVFAISLIGICVDYAYHLLLSAQSTRLKGRALAKYMAPSLMVGGGTTLISYMLLWFVPIVFLHQVAVFVVAGLVFAIFTCLTVMSWQSPPKQHITEQTPVSVPVSRFSVIYLAGIVASVAGMLSVQFQDDIRMFNSTPAELMEQEKSINLLQGNQQYPQFVVIEGESQEQLLQRFERTRSVFTEFAPEVSLIGLDQWVSSAQSQSLNADWLKNGVRGGQLALITEYIDEQTLQSLLTDKQQFMTPEDLPQAITDMMPSIEVLNERHLGVMSYMEALQKSQQAQITLQLDFGIDFVDQPARISASLAELRGFTTTFLGLAVIALCSLMVLRYGFVRGLGLATIPILSASAGLSVSLFTQGYITLFNLLAGILILALSVDYSVFLKEQGRKRHVIVANTLAAATSLLAFGMFVFSQTPAISQFGLTVVSGVVIAYLLCISLPQTFLNHKVTNE